MKLGPVAKLYKRNTTTSKKLTMASFQQIITALSFFQFMTDLEQSGTWIPDSWSVILTFLLISTFYLTKTENRNKKSYTALILLIIVKVKEVILPKLQNEPLKSPPGSGLTCAE